MGVAQYINFKNNYGVIFRLKSIWFSQVKKKTMNNATEINNTHRYRKIAIFYFLQKEKKN